jgi:prepilin-type N-terminal cleavage/methylation domain-containing protein
MREHAFTIIETLVVIAIIGVLFVIVLFTFADKGADKQLDADVLNTKTLLEEARSLTTSAKEASAYGVHFETNKIVLFTGSTYTAGLSTNKESLLNSVVEISSINLSGGGSDVVFDRLTGGTSKSGTVTLRLVSDTGNTRTVEINAVGTVE